MLYFTLMRPSKKKIAVIGLGKLGLPLLAAAASRGFRVIGCDSSRTKLTDIKKGRFHFESGLASLVRRHRDRIELTSDIALLSEASLLFVIVQTPSLSNGAYSLRFVEAAAKDIGQMIWRDDFFRTVIISSTVMPADMEKIKHLLERSSGKKCGKHFGLCYNPTFAALGSSIANLLGPDFVLIGESGKRPGAALQMFYRRFCVNRPKIHRVSFACAELCKISINTYLTMKISFANSLARLAEKLPDTDARTLLDIIASDRRIGPHRGAVGLAYGGPCFPRDNRAFHHMAKELGLHSFLAEATDRTNREQDSHLAKAVLSRASRHDRIAVLGLSYKPGTDVIENSPAISLIHSLIARKHKVVVHDPASLAAARKVFKKKVAYRENFRDCVREADIVVIATPWEAYRKINDIDLRRNGRPEKIIIDCWRLFDGRKFPAHVTHVPFGASVTAPS